MHEYAIVVDKIITSPGKSTEVREYAQADRVIFNEAGGVMFVSGGDNASGQLVVAYASGNWQKVSYYQGADDSMTTPVKTLHAIK
jgi:hypothetical protein